VNPDLEGLASTRGDGSLKKKKRHPSQSLGGRSTGGKVATGEIISESPPAEGTAGELLEEDLNPLAGTLGKSATGAWRAAGGRG